MANQEWTATLPEPASRPDVEHDLIDARALIEEAGRQPDSKKYRKAAEIVLLKILRLDPDNDEARALLQRARNLPEERRAPPASPAPQADPAPEEVPFTAVPLMMTPEPKRGRSKLPLALIAIVVLGAVGLKMRWRTSDANARPVPAAQTESSSRSSFQPRPTEPRSSFSAQQDRSAALPPLVVPAPLTRIQTAPVNVTTVAENGRLAVSSPIATDIFIDGQYIGSTPTTLQLPSGRQTIEYRHGDLRTVISSEIKPNETTAVSITFPVTVQINAKPWAQVFLDDGTRRPLGQTPLSGVAVPIGAVLAFENPNFASKSHRITEKDTSIQVNFP